MTKMKRRFASCCWPFFHHGLILVFLVIGLVVAGTGLSLTVTDLESMRNHLGGWMWPLSGISLMAIPILVLAFFKCISKWRRGRRSSHSLTPFRLLFCLLTIAAWVKIVFIVPNYLPLVILLFASGFCLWAFLLLKEEWFSGRIFVGVDFLCFQVCFFLLLGEVGLRAFALIEPMPILSQTSDTVLEKIKKNRFEPGFLRFGFPFNEQGHYDSPFLAEKNNEFRIVSIGDSCSVGVVPHAYHFTTVCESELRGCHIYNLGTPAGGPAEYLYLMRHEALPLEPDLILVNLFIGNDITDCRTQKAAGDFFYSWLDSSRVLLYLIPERIVKIMRARRTANNTFKSAAEPVERREAMLDSLEKIRALYPWLDDPRQEKPSIPKETFLKLEFDRANLICAGYGSDYREFFGLLEEITEVAGDIPLVFMLIPDEYQVNDGLWNEIESRLTGPALDRDLPQRLIAAWFRDMHCSFLDTLPHFRAIQPLPDGEKHCFHLQDTHPNARGNRILGQTLAAYLSARVPKVDH